MVQLYSFIYTEFSKIVLKVHICFYHFIIQAAAFGLIHKLLDSEGHWNLQSFSTQFFTYNTRKSSGLSAYNDPAKDCHLAVPEIFKPLT